MASQGVPVQSMFKHKESLGDEPKESNHDAADNFEAGEKCPTESKHMAMGNLASLTETIVQSDKTLSEMKSAIQAKKQDEDYYEDEDEDAEPRTRTLVPAIDQDWQWQAFQMYRSKYGGKELRKCGMKEHIPTKVVPFDVIYGMKEDLWAQRDYVNIFSPLLIEIIVLVIPELKYDAYDRCLQVYAAALFHIREKLRDIRVKGVDEVLPGNAPNSEEDRAKQQLHLGHLLRYMDKELEDVLKKYLAMESGHHVPWDLLWAFFPDGTKVVYHCDITDEELLGL